MSKLWALRLVIKLAVVAAIVFSSPAFAVLVCTFSITDINFGSISLATGTNFDTTGTLTINCTGGTSKSTARVCPNLNAGSGGTTTGDPRFLLNGATQLNYNLYSNSARTTVWGSYLWGFSYTPPTIDISLNGAGKGNTSSTIFARIPSGQAKPPGTYTSTFSGGNVQIAYAQSTVGNCATIGATNATSVAFTATTTNVASCSVSSTAFNFGSTGVLSAARDGSSTLTVTCDAATPYTVSLNGGTTGATDPTKRKMSRAGQQITYGLYRDVSRTQPWGDTVGVNTASGTGTGAAQVLTVYGRAPAQATPSPGVYTDTIIATVTY